LWLQVLKAKQARSTLGQPGVNVHRPTWMRKSAKIDVAA